MFYLKLFFCFSESKTKDTTEKLLLIYEFEARVKLNDQGVEHILEKTLKLPDPDPKIFETLAGMSLYKYLLLFRIKQ